MIVDRAEHASSLAERLGNVEQCLREARAPDVLAFLQGVHEELLAEIAAREEREATPAKTAHRR
jgi:hypothetical protein